MQNTTSPIFMYIGGRLRSPLNKPPDGRNDNDTLVGGIHDVSSSQAVCGRACDLV
jgi:hypothetical protein